MCFDRYIRIITAHSQVGAIIKTYAMCRFARLRNNVNLTCIFPDLNRRWFHRLYCVGIFTALCLKVYYTSPLP